MKKLIAFGIMSLVLGGVIAWAGGNYKPRSYDVPVSSYLIAPFVNPRNQTNLWTTNTAFSRGDYIRIYTNNAFQYWWCITAGTSTNAYPTFNPTNDLTEGSVTWRYVNPRRTDVYVINNGSGNISLGFGEEAVAGAGITLNSGGGSYSRINIPWQGEVKAVSAAGSTNAVGVQELP